jgi:hypothetical protein
MIEEMEENLLWDLCSIPQSAFQNWKKHWIWRIANGEEYFKGDKSF